MPKKNYTAEQIIKKLREAEILLANKETVGKTCRKLGISEQTYYRWRKEYGGMQIEQAKQLKVLQKENVQLKKLVAELSLDKAILTEATKGNF